MAESILFSGLTFDADGGSQYGLVTFENWLETAQVSFDSERIAGRHGVLRSPPQQGARFVTASGQFRSGPKSSLELLEDLQSALPVQAPNDDSTAEMEVEFFGQTRFCDAQVSYAGLDPDRRAWKNGVPAWKVVWRCPEPSKYGAWAWSSVVSLEPTVTGLIPPFGGIPKSLPAKPIGGEVTVVNPGTDPDGSPVVLLLSGVQPYNVGVQLVTTGHRVTFDFGLGVGDNLRLESEAGSARLNGATRSAQGPSLISDLAAVPGSNKWRATGVSGVGASVQVGVRPRYSW